MVRPDHAPDTSREIRRIKLSEEDSQALRLEKESIKRIPQMLAVTLAEAAREAQMRDNAWWEKVCTLSGADRQQEDIEVAFATNEIIVYACDEEPESSEEPSEV